MQIRVSCKDGCCYYRLVRYIYNCYYLINCITNVINIMSYVSCLDGYATCITTIISCGIFHCWNVYCDVIQ